MDKNKKASLHPFSGNRKDTGDSPSLGDVLIVSGDEEWVISMEKILNDNLYGTSVASNGDQAVERIEKTWSHIILIDLDSIDIPEDYLARNIRKMEPDIPIIGMGN